MHVRIDGAEFNNGKTANERRQPRSAHPSQIDWKAPEFYDPAAVEKEMQRVFDICHSCRRCFNLCEFVSRCCSIWSINRRRRNWTASIRRISSRVVDACTLCDMCFMTKCPYVPPHEFNLDFPHLMLRYRAMEAEAGQDRFVDRQTRRDGSERRAGADWLRRWPTGSPRATTSGRAGRAFAAGLHPDAALPKYAGQKLVNLLLPKPRSVKPGGTRVRPQGGALCHLFRQLQNPEIGMATRAVLARNGVETEMVYPRCCGMPLLEQGRIAEVAPERREVRCRTGAWIDKGYDIIALVPSCALMLKFEWPLIVPDDTAVAELSKSTFDISEYVVDIARKEGLAPGMAATPAR